jgi:hypothetical protein
VSVDYSAIVGYGYVFSQDAIKYSTLDERAASVYDTVDFDPFDYFFKVNDYDSNSDIFVGEVLREVSHVAPVDIEQLYENDELPAKLNSIVEILNLDVSKAHSPKPMCYLINCCH